MRTKIATFVTGISLVAALAAPASAGTLTGGSVDYVGFNGIHTPVYETAFAVLLVRPDWQIPVGPSDTSATLEASDLSGLPVYVMVAQDMTIVGRFCGATDAPLTIEPGTPLRIFVMAGTCDDGTPSLPTAGTVTAELS